MTTITVTVEGPGYLNRFSIPATTDATSPEWRAWVKALRGAIEHARQLEAATAPHEWQVLVGNVGTVYNGAHYHEALTTYHAYIERSQANDGRAAGEPVTLLRDGEIVREYEGTLAAGGEGGGDE